MDYIISFTPAQLFAAIIGICGGVSVIAGTIGIVVKGIKAAQSPNKKQDEKIAEHDKRLNRHDELFAQDNIRIKRIEEEKKESDRVTQRALLALLNHGISGDATEEMKKAMKDLNDFLIG